jgi:hypothetical protein
MTSMSEMMQQAKQSAKDARIQMEQEGTAQAIKAAVRGQAQLMVLLKEQQEEVKGLRQDVARLARNRSRGGMPWRLLVLAGSAYALYRFNPTVQERVNTLLGQADPGIKGNMARAGQAAGEAAEHLKRGESPKDAIHQVGGEMRRAGEKTMDTASDRLENLKTDAKDQRF